MVTGNAVFKYKTIKGPLHIIPAVIKLVLFLPLSVFCLFLSSYWLAAGIIITAVFSFFCGFSLREQLTDLKPALFYMIFMYTLSLINNIINHSQISSHFPLLFIFAPNSVFLQTVLRLFLIIQLSALIFRTTSSLEIQNVIRVEIISLFIGFIPGIFTTWEAVNLAWRARGGGNGIKRIKSLVFILISISFEKAYLKSRALSARKP